jgi:hypothetical protein
MACRKCGSDWTTPLGKDCNRCPACDKQQRFQARKQGRLPRETQKTCSICGALFTATPQRQMAMTCGSASCRKAGNAEKRRRHKAKKRAGLAKTMAPRQASQPKKTCRREGCTNRVKDNKHEYCGRKCAGDDAREFKRGFKGFSADLRKAASFASWFVDVWEPQRPHLRSNYKPRPACEVCGEETNERHARFCSRPCMKKWRGPRPCKCGVTVEDAKAYARPSCFSCKRKAKAAYRRHLKRLIGDYRKKCRKYGGFYNSKCNRRDILTRDNYICHLCGCKCRNDRNWNHPRAATVDHHPVPLSKGGDHDWHNVRCACRKCNSEKSNKWDGQRRLRLAVSH